MWLIVKFHDDDVAAVPITWIKKENNIIRCFWPRQNVEKKRRSIEIPDESEGEYHVCVILMDGSK